MNDQRDISTGDRSIGTDVVGAGHEVLREAIQRIATGPTMSKDLSREEAREAMRLLLDGRADDVQAGIFLIALRMKRETDAELAGVQEAIHDGIVPRSLDVPMLLSLVDPYDGYLRCVPVAPFLPAVLAACGVPTLSHGVLSMGPKFGASHAQVLRAAGVHIASSLDEAASALESPARRWCHVLQSVIAPELAALDTLRTRIVKRPCLTTIEVALNPFRPVGQSHLLTGFVHKAYPPTYARIAKEGGFDSSIIVRGVEGGVVPSLSAVSRVLSSVDGSRLVDQSIDPASLAIDRSERAVPLSAELADEDAGRVRSVHAPENPFAEALAREAARIGRAALEGQSGAARDSLVYAGAVALSGMGQVASLSDGAERIRQVLDDGTALSALLAD